MKTLTAAIQFGSSRICAAAAMVNEAGQYEVIAIESTTSNGCIRHGNIVSIDDTAARIKTLIQKLSNCVKNKNFHGLEAAYVGMSCPSMHSVKHEPSEVLVGTPEATAEILESLRDQSLNFTAPGCDILGMEANGFRIEGQNVIGEHQVIVTDSNLKLRYQQAMERAGIRVAGFIASPLGLSDLATVEEREQGCVIINLGSALTTISVYKNDSLRLLSVLPLGGDAVSLDIASKGIRFEEAESVKYTYSDASQSASAEANKNNPVSGMPFTHGELNNIVACRYEELILNIQNQIKQSGVESLDGGCILTGGGAIQRGLTTLIQKRLGISTVSARGCSSLRYGQSERKTYLSELMTMLQSCTEDCETKQRTIYQKDSTQAAGPQVIIRQSAKPRTSPAHKETKQTRKSGFRAFVGDLFAAMDDE